MSKPFEVIRETASGVVKPPEAPVALPVDTGGPARSGPYVISKELATAVNVALALDQPLLVTGEPGTGKTSLAWAVAAQLGTRVLEFHTKSTSTARDVLYTFDTLRRFHDASAGLEEARDASRYVTWQALGEAIRSDTSSVVLIDEIDKAPRDFPNDLLNEIDQKEFTVPEVSPPPKFRQRARHFILITSNSERRLPMPFLRRCVYAHVEFPDASTLEKIVALHAGDEPSKGLVSLAVKRFLELRGVERMTKPPATSELIGWVRVLRRMGVDESKLRDGDLSSLPALEALVKTLDDRKLVAERQD